MTTLQLSLTIIIGFLSTLGVLVLLAFCRIMYEKSTKKDIVNAVAYSKVFKLCKLLQAHGEHTHGSLNVPIAEALAIITDISNSTAKESVPWGYNLLSNIDGVKYSIALKATRTATRTEISITR